MYAPLVTAAVVLGCMALLWIASLRLRDASIVDVFWGPGFALVAWTSWALAPARSGRGLLLCVLATVWGLRLALYLAWRRRGRGEDRRYRDMRVAHGARFPLVSLVTVFLLQGALMGIVSLPLQAGIALGALAGWGALDAAGVVLYIIGFVFEAIGDLQLSRFVRDPCHAGRVLDRGLWHYTRHPNYFGDCLVWWGFGAIALSSGAWESLVGPAIMTALLLRVSGVALLERDIADRRPGYSEYVARTSAFFPWPRRADD